MKRATVYLRKHAIYIHSSSATTAGVWVLTSPCVKLERDCSERQIGEQALRALAESKTGLPHPREWGSVLEPLLRLANVKSWSEFARPASCAEIEEEGGRLSVVRTENLGAQEGFRAVPQGPTLVESLVQEVVGAAVRQALLPLPSR